MKTCPKCGDEKSESEFYRCSATNDGLQCWCKLCANLNSKTKYQTDPKARRDYARKRYLKDPEGQRKSSREYRRLNSKKISEYNKIWTELNPGYRREYTKTRYRTDPGFRLSVLLRTRLSGLLRGQQIRKNSGAFKLLGCPIVWLEVHLESLFKPGMTWENHGPVWHIDHIKPCAAFDLRDPEQQKACFHWTNLQPLFALENKQKADSYHG